MAQLNPHRTRNHGSREHRESIKRMLDKTKRDNRTKVLRGQLQKMAVRFTSSFGPDWHAIDAFKLKEKYSSKKFESTGNELKLNGHVVARHHKDGIEVSNAGHDTNKTYNTIKGLGIHARNQKGITKLNNKVIDVNSGEFVLVPHKDISDKPITYTKTKQQKRYRSVGEQSKFRDLVEKNEAAAQGRKGKLPLSQINIQPKDQKQINKITGVKSPIGKEILGVEAHHILSHKKNKGLATNPNNGIMIPKQDHKMLTSFAQLKQRVALISENNTRPNMKSLAQEITNKFKANKLRGSVKGGFTYDPTSDTLLDASIKEQALQIRKIFGGQKGKNLGLNSITEDDMGNKPITDIGIISNQLHKLEKSGKKPILGGYKKGLNASFSIHGSDKDILKSLPHGQESSLSIEPNGNSYLLYPNGKKELITQ